MEDWLSRTRMLLGDEAIKQLANAHVAIFGIGGVGGYAAEALARAGIGHFTLIDHDTVADSNRNRQIIATTETIGQYKTDVMKARILTINPEAVVVTHHCFFLPDDVTLDFKKFTGIADAVDTVSAKIELVLRAKANKVPVISCMGTGNKLDASALQAGDLYETKVCPLAKVMRRELKKRGVESLRVVYSTEEPIRLKMQREPAPERRKSIPGSVSFVPPVAGMIMAGELVKMILENESM